MAMPVEPLELIADAGGIERLGARVTTTDLMSPDLRSSLTAGGIAVVLYVAISLIFGVALGSAVVTGLIIGVITVVVTFVIIRMIAARRA